MRVDAPADGAELQSALAVCCLTERNFVWARMRADGERAIEMFFDEFGLSRQLPSPLFLSMKLRRRCTFDSAQEAH